ncbi:uncharacterized protein LOC130612446 isoform X3 [Hydractinia symbiolongicarpus]|uniref:uncharacterized protein LOC130612446 isoform X3 n=1 Tax=Hydractinia symbiolongicarpus TaxID=13093 RepID=UPI00254CB000|nr:uncharacterized protein LOC130612446 isoform X3 [Hydractinia symbiolongicarpus]
MATAVPPTGSSHHALIANNEYQIKLVTLLNECCDHLREILHDPARGNMPRDKKQLYLSLKKYTKDLNHLKRDQLEIVFPQDKETDSGLFDITILCDVLINCCHGIQAPIGGWRTRKPQPNDFSVGAEIIRIRNERNIVMHGRAITSAQYNRLWNAIEGILKRLGYDITKIRDLKSGCLKDLDLFKIEIMKAVTEILNFNVNKNQDNIKQNQDDIKANKDDIQQNEDGITQNQDDIKANKDNIQQNEDGIKQNQDDIKANKDNIQQNEDGIKQNQDDIKANKDNIQQNEDGIKQNQDDIKANKDNIQQNEDGIKQNQDDIKANKDNIQQNEDGIKQNQDDIKANKDNIQQNEDGIKQNQGDIKANKDNIHQNEDGITQNQDDIKANKDNIQQNEDGIKQNQDDIKANKDNIHQNEDGIKQNQDDIKANKDSIQQNEDGIKQNQDDIKANKDSIQRNEDGITQNQDDIKANKDNIQKNKGGITQNQDDIKANKDNIQQNEDGIKQNQGDIKANKDNIQQNKDGIKQNQDDIKTNKDNIQQNEDGITQNQGDIKANKDNIQQNEDGIKQNQDDIKANKDNIQQNEDGIKQNQDDIKANKDNIQQNEDGIKQNQGDIKANKDNIHQNEDGITQNQDDIKANKDNILQNEDGITQNQDDIKANKDNILQNEDGITQNQDDIKANKDSIQQNEDGITQNQDDIKANKDNIQQNEDGITQNQDDIKANKDNIHQNEDDIKQNQGDIKANKDNILQNEDGIKQNQDDIKANKDNIHQNEDGITQNQDDIKANKDNILQNEDGITQNQDDIKANKDSIQQNEVGITQNQDDIKANKDNIQQNEDGITQNQDDIKANKVNIQQNEDGIKQNQGDIKANKDNIQQNEDGIKQNQDDIKANKDNIQQNEDGIKQNQDDIKANKDNILQNEDGITQNQDDIKANKDSIQQNEDGITQNQDGIKANKDNIHQNEDGIKQNQDDIKANKDSIQQNEDGIKENKDNYNRFAAEVEIVKQTISSSSCDQKSSQLTETIKEQPSYMLLKNFHGDFVIKFDDDCFNWSAQSIQTIITKNFTRQSKELNFGDDYFVEEKEGKLLLLIYNHKSINAESINGLSITLVDSESKTHLISIEDIKLVQAHMCETSHFDVTTHNSRRISEQIKCIVGAEREEADIEFICGGSLQTMEPKEYEAFERDYIQRYFTVNGKCMEEPLQFPPPMQNVTHSLFAQKITDVIIELQHLFTIFTHYNTKEHIRFLKLDKEFSLSLESTITDNKRILLVLPNYIVNIRYTETTDAVRIQDEVKAGEEDLKELSIITKKYLKNGHLKMVNVVAAPHFEDIENIHLCVDCNLLSKKTLAEDRNMMKFFSNILQSSQAQKKVQDNKERYINIVGKVMCFMATRKALYSVPSLSKNVHEQISSLILSPQQLRHLYNNSLKKIIIGPLGSGKTVLALAHLEIAYERSENRSIIYYVVWDGNTLLKRDIVNHTKRFNFKAAVEVVVKDNVELAQDMKMNEVPTPYQLIESLVKKHVDQNLHLIIDELNGELLNKEESSLLKHYLETEDKLNNSFIIFFPQSIEKHRTLISHQKVTIHDKYKYEETGMEVLKLNRAMRTTRIIFQFLKAFENKVEQDKVTMKLPDQKSKDAISTKTKIEKKTNLFSKFWQQLKQPQEQRRQQQQQLQQPPPPQQQQEQGQTTSSNVTPIIKGEEKVFETPVDIDVVAASIQDGDLSGNVRIDISLKFNTAYSIGHNIEGTKPLLIHPANTPTTDKEFIPMLALVLQDVCLHHATKRLFIYNTFPQKDIFYRILKLLKIDFLHYDKYTDWKVLNCDDIIVKNPLQSQNYNLLTTIEGSRGVEAAECICIIESNDCKLKHLTLEAMSRATQNLVLVSASNVYQSDTVKSSTGHIISKLLTEHLVEYNVEVSNDEDTEIPFTKSIKSNNKIVFNIKPQYWKFKKMIKDLEHVGFQATDERLNAHEIVRKNLYPPGKVSNIICSYLSSTSCILRWQQDADKYTVSRQESNSLSWNNLVTDFSCNQYIVDYMVIGESCKFCVIAKNHLGVSDDSIVSYRHKLPNVKGVRFKDIVEIIKSNDIKKLKKLLSIHPNIIHMRGEYKNTPLMWTVCHTNNTSMVEILISYGSDVWAEDRLTFNSYHLAALYDRHTILDMLCRHDVTNINRVDVSNRTPLHYAAEFGHISCVDVLLRHENIDVAIKDYCGRTAFDFAGWVNEQKREIIRRKIKEYEDRTK